MKDTTEFKNIIKEALKETNDLVSRQTPQYKDMTKYSGSIKFIKKLKKMEKIKAKILSKYPKAKIIGVGSNNIVDGIWFIKENAKIKTFVPLNFTNK